MEGATHSFSAACPSLGRRKAKPTSPINLLHALLGEGALRRSQVG